MANESTVGQTGNDQFLTTIPKGIAQAMRMKKGDVLEWLFDKGDLIVRVK